MSTNGQTSGDGNNNAARNPVAVAVIGTSGTGKSSFINLVSGSKLPVSDLMEPCTQDVVAAPDFEIDRRTVRLIDTPGFDSGMSEIEVHKTIVRFLQNQDRQGTKLHGLICLHSISDARMGLGCNSMFRLFKEIFGIHESLGNVVIATTGWDMGNPDRSSKREQELRTDERFLKRALDRGAHLARHDNTIQSAQDILRIIFNKQPSPLAIKPVLVDAHKSLTAIVAGKIPGSRTDRSTGRYDEGSWKEQRYIRIKDRKISSARRSRLFARGRFAREMLRKEVKGILQAVPKDMQSIGEDLSVTVAGLNRLHDSWGKVHLEPVEDNNSVIIPINESHPLESRTQDLDVDYDVGSVLRLLDMPDFDPSDVQSFRRSEHSDDNMTGGREIAVQVEALVQKLNTLRQKERAEIVEMRDALIKSTERLQQVEQKLDRLSLANSGQFQDWLRLKRE